MVFKEYGVLLQSLVALDQFYLPILQSMPDIKPFPFQGQIHKSQGVYSKEYDISDIFFIPVVTKRNQKHFNHQDPTAQVTGYY